MELSEYGNIVSLLIPTGAEYVSMDQKYIYFFKTKPIFVKKDGDSFFWEGAECIGWMGYWPGFIDLDYITNPATHQIDWEQSIAEIEPSPWTNPRTFQMWVECLDRVTPYDSRYATFNHGKMEMWGKLPFYENGEWKRKDNAPPHTTFYASEDMLLFEPGEKIYKFGMPVYENFEIKENSNIIS